jgi:hypothetical protein
VLTAAQADVAQDTICTLYVCAYYVLQAIALCCGSAVMLTAMNFRIQLLVAAVISVYEMHKSAHDIIGHTIKL